MNKTKRIPLYLMLILPLTLLYAKDNDPEEKRPLAPPAAKFRTPLKPGISELGPNDEVAVITTDFGQIILRFYPQIAPRHTSNFKSLARSKFYDGTTFHRVIPGFMIQGGDPNSRDDDLSNDGFGRGPRLLRAEFSNIPHKRGILSMARGRDPNSASCQFFIVVADSPHLDGQYTVFGKVVKGMEVVDKIVNLPTKKGNNPGKAAIIRSIRIKKAGEVLDLPAK